MGLPKNVSPTLEINQIIKSRVALGQKTYAFGFGQSPFPIPETVVEAFRAHADHKDYIQTAGLHALREVVAAHYTSVTDSVFDAGDVLIGPGSKELIFIAQLVLKRHLILPAPSWVSYAPQARILNRRLSWLNTSEADNWCLNPDDLDAFCQSRPGESFVLILNYPNNPTGSRFDRHQLSALAGIVRKHGIIVISDEIYGKTTFDDDHKTIADFYPEGTIITTGMSKWCGAGGWRLGLAIFPKALENVKAAMTGVASETYSCVNAPTQYAGIAAYTFGEDIQEYVRRTRKILRVIASFVVNSLNKNGIHTVMPKGGFYCFPNFEYIRGEPHLKKRLTSKSLCKDLLNTTGVALLPGSFFGRPSKELTARLSFVDFDGNNALKMIKDFPIADKDYAFVHTHCPQISEGVFRLIEYIKN